MLRIRPVWERVPGILANAQELGNYNATICESTFKRLERTSPKEAGDCLEAAWTSDDPGYTVDAEPAGHLKKVQMSVGAGLWLGGNARHRPRARGDRLARRSNGCGSCITWLASLSCSRWGVG